ncbi:MAG: SDR family NAD(P)-dependent oxidoreductase [Desulfobacteraceae bacterium]|jgi:meso-butanediol dehydrogenase/(S,S)-butanediol dehydrogenase/diacetyl reductase
MNRLDGKVAVTTGGARGIGRAVVEKLYAEGAHVIIADAGPCEFLEETATAGQGPTLSYRYMDVTDENVVGQVFQDVFAIHGRLDILVNNAGIAFDKPIEETTEAEWDLMMNVNLKGVFLCTKYAVPLMRRTGGGAIVNIGSLEGLAANPRRTAYAASKGGVHALTRAVALDHGPDNIRCNAVCPGWINTPFNDSFFETLKDQDAGRRAIIGLHPVGRMGLPEDVANTVCWLVSDESGFITGQEIVVDGGRLCRLPLADFEAMERAT